mgnify:CR=1 FL=1
MTDFMVKQTNDDIAILEHNKLSVQTTSLHLIATVMR